MNTMNTHTHTHTHTHIFIQRHILRISETSVRIHKPTRPNIHVGLKFQQHRCNNLKTHTIQDSLNVMQGMLPVIGTQGTHLFPAPLHVGT
jgi:hypothetical protein